MTQRPRVFITGGRRGIGRGIAYGFSEAGYDVVINDIVEDEATAETLAGLRERCGSAALARFAMQLPGAAPALRGADSRVARRRSETEPSAFSLVAVRRGGRSSPAWLALAGNGGFRQSGHQVDAGSAVNHLSLWFFGLTH